MAKKLQAGDILGANRGVYWHYGIYAGKGSVIHYTAGKGDFGDAVSIQKTSFKRFRKKSPCYVCRLSESFTRTHTVFSPEETLERALSRLGETSYRLFSNNCEHFVLWCKTGYAESEQAERLKLLLSSILLTGKGTPLFTRPELQDEIRGIVIQGLFDFFDTVTDGIYALGEKIGKLDSSGDLE
jgi:hypothetical protein